MEILKRNRMKKKKLGPISKSQQKILNQQFFGGEPEPATILLDDRISLIKILNWYSSNIDKSTAYSFLKEYCKNNDMLHIIKNTNEKSYPKTVYTLARLMNRGYKLADTDQIYFDKTLLSPFKSEENDEAETPVASTNKRSKDNVLIETIEEVLDNDNYSFDIKDYIRNHNIANYKLDECKLYYEPLLQELVHIKQDPQLKEAYKKIPSKTIKDRIEFLQKLIEACTITKKVRVVVRKPKEVDKAKLLKTFNYKAKDDETGVISINPEKIIGAKELWMFDAKYNVLTKLVANENETLSVKGTTIININENTSISKRAGRSKKLVTDIVSCGKVALRQVFNQIKTEPIPLKTRTNEFTLLLRVIND